MYSLAMCIAVAPAQGYRESDQRPLVKLGKVATASTAITSEEEKALQNGSFPGGRSVGGIYSGGR
jgi:hypothetical protein